MDGYCGLYLFSFLKKKKEWKKEKDYILFSFIFPLLIFSTKTFCGTPQQRK
jgi:hypothetical protein